MIPTRYDLSRWTSQVADDSNSSRKFPLSKEVRREIGYVELRTIHAQKQRAFCSQTCLIWRKVQQLETAETRYTYVHIT